MRPYSKVGGSTGNDRQRGRDGMVRRALRRLAAPNEQRADAELKRDAGGGAATPIRDCTDRERVELCGDISSANVSGAPDKPAFEVELDDGSGVVTLVWLGRREIPGLEPGRRIRISGRISCQAGGQRVIFNPRYDID